MRCGLIGERLGHTWSPYIHNSIFSAMGMDAVYIPMTIPREKLASAVDVLRDGFGGFNVTIAFNEDNQTLAILYGRNGAPDTYYILEAHEGTYTGPGRVYDAAAKTIRDGGGTAPVEPEPEPADQPSNWAREQVAEAVEAGLVPEALQSKYQTAITRAEFCALAVELYEGEKGEITERASFTDSTDENVEKMAGLGVVNGVGDGLFEPDRNLTREEAATILSRLAEAMDCALTDGTPDFADASEISSWAAGAVARMQNAGVMNGIEDNRFAPEDPYTREQSILTVLRLFHLV